MFITIPSDEVFTEFKEWFELKHFRPFDPKSKEDVEIYEQWIKRN